MKKNLLYALMIGLTLIFTACPEDEVVTPYAYFEASAYSVAVNQNVVFDNQSEDAETYGWKFGDGSISTDISPTHSYNNPGTYTVTLLAYNKGSQSEHSASIEVLEGEIELKACFSANPTVAEPGQTINFTNCSENATSYLWNFGDGTTSYEINPSHSYTSTGNYYISLTAYNGTGQDFVEGSVTITNTPSDFDPRVYSSTPSNGWDTHYYTDYSESGTGDWTEETNSDYSAIISNSVYSIENYSYDNGWFFWTNNAEMPDQSGNFDIDVYYRIVYDDSTYGDGLVWALNNGDSYLDYFYYRYTHYENDVWYIFGDTEVGSWIDGIWGQGGNYEGFNKLSIRKYLESYYLFMNEVLVGEYPFKDFFGPNFGFYIGKRSKMEIEEYGIFNMDFSSAKSYSAKMKTPTKNENAGSGVMKMNSVQKLK